MQAGFRMPRQKDVVHFWCITIKHLNVYSIGMVKKLEKLLQLCCIALAGIEPDVILNMYT